MNQLTQNFIDQCPVDDGFRLRGMDMTRIEVFVDAAFAFAVTMLVISFDSIPQSFSEMQSAIKNVPAFIFSVVQIVWIWHAHNVWSKRFGLDNGMTVFLSTSLLIVVLVYIYPMRIMNQGMMSYFTNDYLYSPFNLDNTNELAMMFVFLGSGFFALCLVFIALNHYALSLKSELRLNAYEIYETKTLKIVWLGSAGVSLICIALSFILPPIWLPFSGFSLFLLTFWIPYISIKRGKNRPRS